ncbi:hypothetical protein ABPG72_011930 [Tetrahymena utriculariae]
MNITQLLLNILNSITVSRELMFDITEIPHCMEMLNQTFFTLDMQRIKSAHQYMKGNIPQKMYLQIKQSLQKYLYVLLQSHKELIKIDPEHIEDEETLQIYLYIKQYFSPKQKSQEQIIDSKVLRDDDLDFDHSY